MIGSSLPPPGGAEWELAAFIIGVFLQLLGLPFVAVSQVSLFSKVTAEKTQGDVAHVTEKKKKTNPKAPKSVCDCVRPSHPQVSARASGARWGGWPPSWARCGLED